MTRDTLSELQHWYVEHCDGDWEHDWRVRITTLDNPGWSVAINLADTPSSDVEFKPVESERGPNDWYSCWMESSVFHAACGPVNLSEVIEIFLTWYEPLERT